MSKFKVGDRVAVYGGSELLEVSTQHRYLYGKKAKVTSITSETEIVVTVDKRYKYLRGDFVVHPKQCRLLKPRKPRRRVWLSAASLDQAFQGEGSIYSAIVTNYKAVDDDIEFIEVRKKKQ